MGSITTAALDSTMGASGDGQPRSKRTGAESTLNSSFRKYLSACQTHKNLAHTFISSGMLGSSSTVSMPHTSRGAGASDKNKRLFRSQVKQERSQNSRATAASGHKLDVSTTQGETREDNDAYGTRSASTLAAAVRKEASKSFIKIMEKHASDRRDKFISFVPKTLNRKGQYNS